QKYSYGNFYMFQTRQIVYRLDEQCLESYWCCYYRNCRLLKMTIQRPLEQKLPIYTLKYGRILNSFFHFLFKDIHTPFNITILTCRMASISFDGSPSTKIISASFPFSILPNRSSIWKNRAFSIVAATMISMGLSPASRNNSISRKCAKPFSA